jgi:uncharacterized SAM-binding protein YcdF (DUF218 family)
VVLITAVVGGWPVYVRPQTDPLRHADAIVVLGGPNDDRYEFGLQLRKQGWAPMLFLSNPGASADLTKFCVKHHADYNLHCFVPDAPTTKGEARTLHGLAAQYGWRTVIVVTLLPHISRARYILEQCFDGRLIMVENPTDLSIGQWAFQYVYQTAGYLRALVQPGC